jgi:hypothetical protein
MSEEAKEPTIDQLKAEVSLWKNCYMKEYVKARTALEFFKQLFTKIAKCDNAVLNTEITRILMEIGMPDSETFLSEMKAESSETSDEKKET